VPASLSKEEIEAVIAFHGHSCPGLSIGIRAAELARRELGTVPDSEMVCVSETDMCGVDAIQYLLGCTFGKGNLIHRDYGKMAFSFHHRPSGKGFRVILKPEARGDIADELAALHRKISAGNGDETDKQKAIELRKAMQDKIMDAELDELFHITEPKADMPGGPRILESLTCEECGEPAMESRTRRFAGRTLCLPCFNKFEQKV
jgi:formylmethanofuran dehydrogenase subunit E